jgi:ParB family transcriptional regulator, chromosome partitioning protein
MASIENVYPEEVVIIGVDTEDGDDHPLFDERIYYPIKPEFEANVRGMGVIVPVILKRDGERLIVVDGRQRVRAARLVNAKRKEIGEAPAKIPVRVRPAETSQLMGMSIVTNEHRTDDDVLVKSFKTLRAMQQTNDEAAVAEMFSVTTATVRNRMKIAEAAPELHDALRRGLLTATAALEIARVPGHDAQRKMLEEVLNAVPAGDGAEAEHVSGGDVAAAKRERKKADGGGQRGIRRTWLRKAAKTEAFKALDNEQREVLMWFIEGSDHEQSDAWYMAFMREAEIELGDKA